MHLVALVGLAVVLAAWVTLAFAESSPPGETAEELEAVVHAHATDSGADRNDWRERIRQSGSSLAIEVSMPEFVELQALDDSGRRERFGLPAACTPGMTAMMVRTPAMTRMIMVITCTGNSRE